MHWLARFFATEAAGGIVLLLAALTALVLANSHNSEAFAHFLHTPLHFSMGESFALEFSLMHFINDGLMALFFLMVGVEIKHEFLEGELRGRNRAALPLIAAVGGVLVPALIYLSFNQGTTAVRGWAIPTATDIAFALGILALFGKRATPSMKMLLMSIAVIDDLIAVIIIALFYTQELQAEYLWRAVFLVFLLLGMARAKVAHFSLYFVVGLLLWYAVYRSGVHATIAGVLLGFCLPLDARTAQGQDLAKSVVRGLHPWVAFGIVPLFALANAAVTLPAAEISAWIAPIPLGIALGLLIGKPVGILGAAFLASKFRIAHLPEGMNWTQALVVSCVAGIGFTMSLFIGILAFTDEISLNAVRLGVLSGSLCSALFAAILAAFFLPVSRARK